MKQGISYSFLLNIVILFVFVCGAVITGIFSYYRAFKANTIIINEIEKYEGYNCLTKDSIAKKLSSVSYNVPFNVKCKSSYGEPCITDNEENGNYAVVAYNLDDRDVNDGRYFNDDDELDYIHLMNAKIYEDDESYTKEYQFGVYTYLYTDLPIISGFIRIPFFSKTRKLYEFRNIKVFTSFDYDSNYIPNGSGIMSHLGKLKANTSNINQYEFGVTPSKTSYLQTDISKRESYMYYLPSESYMKEIQNIASYGERTCGFKLDWSAY